MPKPAAKTGWRRLYERWRDAGVCVWCGDPKVVTKRHCEAHRERYNRLISGSEKRRKSRVRRKRVLKRNGLCCVCMAPRVNASHCDPCRIRHNELVRESRRRLGR